MKRVGFGLRFLAAILDGIILGAILYILSMVTGGKLFTSPVSMFGSMDSVYFANILASLIYFSLEIFTAATPGKMLLKLKIQNEKGKSAATNALLVRYLLKHSSQICYFLFAITTMRLFWTLQTITGLIIFLGGFLIFTQSKQTLHDRLSKTAVYKGK